MLLFNCVINHDKDPSSEQIMQSLGEVLDGDRMAVSLYDITFKETFEQKVLCKLMLSEEDISVLQNAIEDLYYFEFVYGKLRE